MDSCFDLLFATRVSSVSVKDYLCRIGVFALDGVIFHFHGDEASARTTFRQPGGGVSNSNFESAPVPTWAFGLSTKPTSESETNQWSGSLDNLAPMSSLRTYVRVGQGACHLTEGGPSSIQTLTSNESISPSVNPFSVEEVKTAYHSMPATSSTCPDGFGPSFYRSTWGLAASPLLPSSPCFPLKKKSSPWLNLSIIAVLTLNALIDPRSSFCSKKITPADFLTSEIFAFKIVQSKGFLKF